MINRIDLPPRTIAKVVLTVALIWLLWQVWTQVLVLIIAVLLSLAFEPWVESLERRGWPRGVAVGALAGGLVVALAILLLLILPPLIDQGTQFAEELPDYINDVQVLLDAYPQIRDWMETQAEQAGGDPGSLLPQVTTVGTGIISAFANTIIALVLTLYLVADGGRIFNWLISGLSPQHRSKAVQMRTEISRVVGGYIAGQAITSLLFAIFTFVTLSLAGVPEPLLLAVLAGLLDAIPVIGPVAATIPAVLLAATISFPLALVILALYIVYQQFENYVIIPRVFGGTLQISSFAILVAIMFGGALLGVIGVLLALPIAAAIPAIVRVWRAEDTVESTDVEQFDGGTATTTEDADRQE